MVQAQRVPSEYVQSVVTSDITSRLNSITQQVMSRTNIERIIEEYNLFSNPKDENMFLEDKVEDVRNRIGVDVIRSSTFTISFNGADPESVKNIANSLASFFIDENLKVREAQATSTSDFLDDELETMKQRLEKSEQEYVKYRQKYMGELPEQLGANLAILERLSLEMIEQQQALREAGNAVAALEQQISESRQTPRAMAPDDAMQDIDSGDLGVLKEQLEVLLARYTENHPSVVRLKSMIRKMEEKTLSVQGEGDENQESSSRIESAGTASPQENQLAVLKQQVRNIELDIANNKQQAEFYQKRVENIPKREEELFSIKRDYENLKDIYDSLLGRRLEAELSVNMEKKQKGEQFQIIDSARVPEKPIAPNMKLIFLGSLAMGLGFGGGIVYLLEFMNNSFKSPESVESTLGLPVIAAIPVVRHRRDKFFRRLNNVCSAASVALSFILLGVFGIIMLKGSDRAIAFFKGIVGL